MSPPGFSLEFTTFYSCSTIYSGRSSNRTSPEVCQILNFAESCHKVCHAVGTSHQCSCRAGWTTFSEQSSLIMLLTHKIL
jgi:hypothetical protein